MKTLSEQDLVAWIAGIVAGACIVAVIVLSVRQKRRLGHFPPEVVGGHGHLGWFGTAWLLWIVGRSYVPSRFLDALPVATITLGVDLALLVAFAVLGAYALASVFRADWDRRWGLYIVPRLVFVALSVGFVVMDARRIAAEPWLWIFAVLIAVFLSPYCARWAYEEFHLRQASRALTADSWKLETGDWKLS